jgi:hypothetical protein
VKLNTHLHLALWLWMSGAIASAPSIQLNGLDRVSFSLFTGPNSVSVSLTFRLYFVKFLNSNTDS